MLLSDDPITEPEDDLLGHGALVERLHAHLKDWSYRQGLVIAVSGGAGQGKTSFKNLLARRLRRGFIVADLNPWYFEEEQDMVEGFLTALSGSLVAELDRSFADTAGTIVDEVRGKLSVLPAVHVFGFGLDFSKLKPGEKSLDSLWDEMGCLLEETHKRVVVLLDDLDRLPKPHLLLLVKVIRLWTMSRKIVYVLPFDGERMRRNLAEELAAEPDFLRRVISLEVPLPPIERGALDDFWWRHFRGLLAAASLPAAPESLDPVYRETVAPLIGSLRDAKRHLNALAFAQPWADAASLGELLAAEARRVLGPEGGS